MCIYLLQLNNINKKILLYNKILYPRQILMFETNPVKYPFPVLLPRKFNTIYEYTIRHIFSRQFNISPILI